MNAEKFANIFLSLAAVAMVTTLVLPGRQTPAVLREGFGGLSKLTSASLGQR